MAAAPWPSPPTSRTEDQANQLVRRAHGELGGMDILVNNAGVMLLGPVMGAETAQWRRMIDVNLLGLLYCTHAALPLMEDTGEGTSSTSPRWPAATPTWAPPSTP